MYRKTFTFEGKRYDVTAKTEQELYEKIFSNHTDLKNGVKITITLKKDANAQVILNNLYKHTNVENGLIPIKRLRSDCLGINLSKEYVTI